MIIFYFLIGLLTSIIGAIAGIGGGVIIKPILDFLGHYDIGTISILSASSVLAMSVVSLSIMFITKKTKINYKTSGLLAFSSMIGGFFGKKTFIYLIEFINNIELISFIQSIILTILMSLILIYHLMKHKLRAFHLQHTMAILFIGFILGIIAAFLGIGGGPFNVAILTLGFSMQPKEASANSIFIILFSQTSSLLTTTFTTGFSTFELDMLTYIVIGAIIGGILGSALLARLSHKYVDYVFTVAVILIIFINIYNSLKIFPYIS